MAKKVNSVKNYVGIDIGKKNLEVVRLKERGKIERFRCKSENINSLLNWLTNEDKIVMEAGNQAFRISKEIKRVLGIESVVLNPSELANIYNSLKKTDKEDALKLARLVQRIPAEELPVVSVPTDEEEDARRLSTEQAFWNKQLTQLKNRLHNIFTQAGLTNVTKKDLSSAKKRKVILNDLPERYRSEVVRLMDQISSVENSLKDVEKEIKSYLSSHVDEMGHIFSMPGIGPMTALAIWAYIGDGRRFSKSKQVTHYVGLVPRVDISGNTVRYGRIKGGCVPIRRCIVQGAWVLVKSTNGGAIRKFYHRKMYEIGKKKAIVAVARKMIETIYVMLQKKELYQGVSKELLYNKLKSYGLINNKIMSPGEKNS